MSRGSAGGGHDDDCCGGGVLVVVEMLLFPVFRGVMLPGFQGFYAGFRQVRTTTAGTTDLFPEFADDPQPSDQQPQPIAAAAPGDLLGGGLSRKQCTPPFPPRRIFHLTVRTVT